MRETHFKFLQYLTGIGIFFLVGLHLIISHLSSGEPEAWSSVSQRAASAGWLTIYILFRITGSRSDEWKSLPLKFKDTTPTRTRNLICRCSPYLSDTA